MIQIAEAAHAWAAFPSQALRFSESVSEKCSADADCGRAGYKCTLYTSTGVFRGNTGGADGGTTAPTGASPEIVPFGPRDGYRVAKVLAVARRMAAASRGLARRLDGYPRRASASVRRPS